MAEVVNRHVTLTRWHALGDVGTYHYNSIQQVIA